MFLFHQCKTTTTQETLLHEDDALQTRAQMRAQLSYYTKKRIYQDMHHDSEAVAFIMKERAFQLPMQRSLTGLYLIPVTVGQDTYRFVIDSGAQVSGMREELLKTHHATPLPAALSIGSIGGTRKPMPAYLTDELSIKSLVIRKLPMIALQPPRLPFTGKDYYLFDGIIGWDILAGLDFEMDDVAKVFKIVDNRYSFAYPNMVQAIFPLFLVRDRQHQLLKMGFDTGARYSWVNKSAMERLGYPIGKPTAMYGYGVHGLEEMKVQLIQNMDLYLYKAHIHLHQVHTGTTAVFPNMPLDGILGNEIFRNRRIRVINSKETVLLL